MLREYLSNIADQFRTHLDTTEPINAQDFADKIGEVYDKGLLEGLAQAKAEGRKTKYVEEYFTGSKQYLTYSIDFEPKLIVFLSNDGLTDFETNKPNTNNPIVFKQIIDCKLGFAEGQNYLVRGTTAYRYDTKNYAVATGIFTNYAFNDTTGKWDVTLGRADTSASTATLRFVSNGAYPSQILFVGDKEQQEEEPSVLRGIITLTEKSRILTIEGLPKAPKELNLMCLSPKIPTDTNEYNIYAIDYYAEGFTLGTSNIKRVASITSTVHKDVSSNYYSNTTINESVQIETNMFLFENGIFKIDFSNTSKLYFCENFSCKWTVVF